MIPPKLVVRAAMSLGVMAAGGCTPFPTQPLNAAVDAAQPSVDADAAYADHGSDEAAPDAPTADLGAADVPPLADVADVPVVSADAGITVRGAFVSAAVRGSGGAYGLGGALTWHAAVHGSAGGFTLNGWLQ